MTIDNERAVTEALAIRLYPFTGVYGTKSHKDCSNTQEAARAVLDAISKGAVAGRPALVVTDELVDRAFTAYMGTVVHGNEFTRWRAALTAALTAAPLRVHHTPGEDIAPVFPATDPEREAMERVCEAADAWDKFDNIHDPIETGNIMASLQAAVAALRKFREGKPAPVVDPRQASWEKHGGTGPVPPDSDLESQGLPPVPSAPPIRRMSQADYDALGR